MSLHPATAAACLCLAVALPACERAVLVGYLPEDAGPEPLPQVSWPTGVHTGNDPARYAAFEAFRGRPIDLAMFFPDRTVGWRGVVEPAWPVDMLDGIDARLVLALPLYPEGVGNNQDCATGAYDVEWEKLGPFLTGRGRGDSVIRLGWGPNDAAHPWRADADPSDYVACFQHVADAIRSGGPELTIAWDFNPAGRPDNTALDPFDAYPGDAFVDYVGIEHFDRYPPAVDAAAWDTKCHAPTGLCSVLEFARAHGKRLGLNEWGVVSCGEESGGDNPLFVLETVRALADAADVVGYELYYEDGAEHCSVLSDGNDNPLAAAEYRAIYAL